MVTYGENVTLQRGDHFYTCPACRKSMFVRTLNKEGLFAAREIKFCPICGNEIKKEMTLEDFQRLIGERK